MDKKFAIATVILGTLAMLVVWILVAALFITPQYKIAHEAGLESVAETILILQWFASFIVGHYSAKFCIKAIGVINKQED